MPAGKKKNKLAAAQATPANVDSSSEVSDDENGNPYSDAFFERLTKCLTASITASLNICMDKLIKSVEDRLNLRIDVLETSLFDANKRIDALEKVNVKLDSDNVTLRSTITSLNNKIDTLEINVDEQEQYSRHSNLLIHGLQEVPNEKDGKSLTTAVIDMLNTNLQLSIAPSEISALHRLRRMNSSHQASQSSKPASIVVQFSNRSIRNEVLLKRKLLKGQKISITEQLTVKRVNILNKANELVRTQKIASCWSHDGRILVKSRDDVVSHIISINDLNRY